MIVLDGPMGTRLIARGVRSEDVVRASLDRPSEVVAVHAEDLAAGARIVLSNTFALPFFAFDLDLEAHVRAALRCAARAGAPEVLVSLGPPAPGDAERHREAMARVLTSVVMALKTAPAMGVMFETLRAQDASWLPEAAATLRAEGVPFIASFLANERMEFPAAAIEGAFALGCNCALFDPRDAAKHSQALAATLAAAKRLALRSLAKPAITRDTVPPALAEFDFAGVCCGGTAAHVAQLARMSQA